MDMIETLPLQDGSIALLPMSFSQGLLLEMFSKYTLSAALAVRLSQKGIGRVADSADTALSFQLWFHLDPGHPQISLQLV